MSSACALLQSVKVGLRDTFSCTYYAEDCSVYAAEEYDSDGAEAELNLYPEAIFLKPSQPITAGAIQTLPALSARDTDFIDPAYVKPSLGLDAFVDTRQPAFDAVTQPPSNTTVTSFPAAVNGKQMQSLTGHGATKLESEKPLQRDRHVCFNKRDGERTCVLLDTAFVSCSLSSTYTPSMHATATPSTVGAMQPVAKRQRLRPLRLSLPRNRAQEAEELKAALAASLQIAKGLKLDV